MKNSENNVTTSERLEQYKLLREYLNEDFKYSRFADGLEFVDIEKILNDLASRKNERLKEIIQLRYGVVDGKCYSLKELSEQFNVTPQRIGQLVQEGNRWIGWLTSDELIRIFCQQEITPENKEKIQQYLCAEFNQHIDWLPPWRRQITEESLNYWRNLFDRDINGLVKRYKKN